MLWKGDTQTLSVNPKPFWIPFDLSLINWATSWLGENNWSQGDRRKCLPPRLPRTIPSALLAIVFVTLSLVPNGEIKPAVCRSSPAPEECRSCWFLRRLSARRAWWPSLDLHFGGCKPPQNSSCWHICSPILARFPIFSTSGASSRQFLSPCTYLCSAESSTDLLLEAVIPVSPTQSPLPLP